MEKLSVRKFSILGLALTAASAITAAILPSEAKSNAAFAFNGTLTASSSNPRGETCKPRETTGAFNCFNTASGVGQASGDTAKGGTISNQTTQNDDNGNN